MLILREEYTHTPLSEDFARLKWKVTLPLKMPCIDDHMRQCSQSYMIGYPFVPPDVPPDCRSWVHHAVLYVWCDCNDGLLYARLMHDDNSGVAELSLVGDGL